MNAPDLGQTNAAPTAALVRRALDLEYGDIPAPVVRVAKQALLDWFGCTIAGANDPLVDLLVAEARDDGAAGGVPLVGRAERFGRRDAAFINGAASHVLDYDDVNTSYTGHPTVALVPALLAYGAGRKLDGRAFLAAYVAGYETLVRVGVLAGHVMYNHGFHATGVCGIFGAAAAVGRLAGLSAEALGRAFGIAGTQSAGLKSNFGTMCKAIHAGMAARNGMEAALLAARGCTGRPDILECEQGFVRTHSPEMHVAEALGPAPSGWYTRDTLFKYHAACYMTHAPIECARKIRAEVGHALDAGQIRRARMAFVADADRMCNIAAPKSGLEAKFSVRQTLAMALADVDTAGLANYSETTATDPRLVALRDRIEVELRPDFGHTYAEMTLETTDGRTITARHDAGVPWADLDRQEQALRAKFEALAAPVIGPERTRRLAEAVLALEDAADVDVLVALTTA